MGLLHPRRARDVAPYLLGALPGGEARTLERHLAGCAECREQLERLRPAAESLPRGVEQVSPPPELKASVLRAVDEAGEQRETQEALTFARPGLRAGGGRTRLAVAAMLGALLLIGGGALGGSVLSRGLAPEEDAILPGEVDRLRAPEASARLVVPASRSEMPFLRVDGLPPLPRGRVYQVWASRAAHTVPQSLLTLSADGSGTAGVPDGLGGVDAVLVTREPAGGRRTPSGDPVVTVKTP